MKTVSFTTEELAEISGLVSFAIQCKIATDDTHALRIKVKKALNEAIKEDLGREDKALLDEMCDG